MDSPPHADDPVALLRQLLCACMDSIRHHKAKQRCPGFFAAVRLPSKIWLIGDVAAGPAGMAYPASSHLFVSTVSI